MRAFAEALRAMRTAAGLTQHELAERAELSVRFIQRVEQGRQNPSLKTLIAIAWALNTATRELLK